MEIHKEGYKSIAIAFIVLASILIIINLIWPTQTILHYILYFLTLVTFAIVFRFFRIPNRDFIVDDNSIMSSADGQVVVIEEINETKYFKEKRLQISVFMSPFNVHINYFPINGDVISAEHEDGKHYPAYKPKASMLNEMSNIIIRHNNGHSLLVRQIAGLMARRIVCFCKKGTDAKQGKQLGLIKFGSRVDLLLPIDVKVKVEIGQKVKAGLDVIASFD